MFVGYTHDVYAAGARTTPTITIPGEPVGIAVDGLGKIYVANFCAGPSGQGSVMTYKPNGTPTTPILTDQDNIDEPVDLWIAGNKLVVANNFGGYHHAFAGYITTYTLDGKQIPPTITQGVEGSVGVAVDNSGKVFVANSLAGSYGNVTKYLPKGSQTGRTIKKGVREPFLIAIH